MLGLNLFNFTGVVYNLIIHLYCMKHSQVLMVCDWALEHIIPHSSSDISSFKSCIQSCLFLSVLSLLLFIKILYNCATRPLLKQFCVENDSSVDSGGCRNV